jgi:hypothetical protein
MKIKKRGGRVADLLAPHDSSSRVPIPGTYWVTVIFPCMFMAMCGVQVKA